MPATALAGLWSASQRRSWSRATSCAPAVHSISSLVDAYTSLETLDSKRIPDFSLHPLVKSPEPLTDEGESVRRFFGMPRCRSA